MTRISRKALKTLKYLEAITHDMRAYDYEHIRNVLHSLPQMAMPIAIVNKGWTIQRGMRNYGGELFTSQSRISCISDRRMFHLINKGRANQVNQPIFYGSLYSSLIPDQEYTCLSEISPILKHPNSSLIMDEPEIYTIGTWRIKEDFKVAEITFSDDAIANNPEIKDSFDYQLKQLPNDKDREYYIRQLKLISTDYAKTNIRNPNEYNLSCAYSNIVYNQGLAGITYPSVRTLYRSNNIALVPKSLNSIDLESVMMYKVQKRKNNIDIIPFKHCTSMGVNKDNFEWSTI